MRGVQRRCEAVKNVDQAFIIGEICNEEIGLLVITRCSYRKVQVRGSMRMATEGAQNISDWPIVWLQTSVNGESKQRTNTHNRVGGGEDTAVAKITARFSHDTATVICFCTIRILHIVNTVTVCLPLRLYFQCKRVNFVY